MPTKAPPETKKLARILFRKYKGHKSAVELAEALNTTRRTVYCWRNRKQIAIWAIEPVKRILNIAEGE